MGMEFEKLKKKKIQPTDPYERNRVGVKGKQKKIFKVSLKGHTFMLPGKMYITC